MRRLIRFLFVASVFMVFAGSADAQESAGSPSPVSSVSTWPTADLLKHKDKAEITTFDMPGVPFPCRVQSVTADQLICGRTHKRQMVAFDRKQVQSISVVGHPRHKASLLFFVSSAGLLVGGLACASAGGSVACAGLLTASIATFVGGQVAEHTERNLGPTDARVVYIAPVAAPATTQQPMASSDAVPFAKEDAPIAATIE